MSSSVVSRRRQGTINMEEDEIELVDNDALTITVSESRSSTPSPNLTEENHVTRRGQNNPIKMLKRRLAQDSSPKGKYVAWWLTVLVLFVLAVTLLSVPLILEGRGREDCSDFEEVSLGEDYEEFPFLYWGDTGTFVLCRQGRSVLRATLGVNHVFSREIKVNVYNHSSNTVLNITRHPGKSNNCLRIEWIGIASQDYPLTDCFELEDSHWFGAYELYNQQWPLERNSLPEKMPFLPHDYLEDPDSINSFGSVLHPLWLTSSGVGLLVDEGVQLYVSINNATEKQQLCLHAQPFELECAPKALDKTFFNYSLCTFESVSDVAQYLLKYHVPHPNETPAVELFQKPIWTSWPYLQTVSETTLRSYVDEITSIGGFGISQLAINNSYSRNDGLDLQLNLSSFHSISSFGAWVHPFIPHTDSDFSDALMSAALLPGTADESVTLVKWWDIYGAIINTLNSTISDFHSQKFNEFAAQNKVNVLKFDGGQYTVLPECVLIEGLAQPGDFTKSYVQFVSERRTSSSNFAEVRVGFFTQDQPVIIQLLDRRSDWGPVNGLQSVLNTVLALGIGGYPFVVPGTIGGTDKIPNEELYIRWMQLNTFLPFMQFSTPPSVISQRALEQAKILIPLHITLNLTFIELAQNATITGHPIIRPFWWLSALDAKTVNITDQFLIGDSLMVAPVLESGVVQKMVYFPTDTEWVVVQPVGERSKCDQSYCSSGRTVTFRVNLEQVLYFKRVP